MHWIMLSLQDADLEALDIPSMHEAARIYCNYTGTARPNLSWYFSFASPA